jgi:DNA polymerase-3 subunit epsilon
LQFAVVDIETTGGYAAANGITEISIYVHDGQQVIDHFETLINPNQAIPSYIQALTGITDEMVTDAPQFEDVAKRIASILENRVFVAHNVNFDYSFVKHQLSLSGFELGEKKLCTVRLSRKVMPGLRSYSLGKLCQELGIEIYDRHRAGGDARATVTVLEFMLRKGGMSVIQQFLKKTSGEQFLPLNLAKEEIDALPHTPGVYYFHDEKGRIIYVGKARDIRRRVVSHFSHNGAGLQRQEFMRNIFHITYQSCATELMAFILECVEIKKYWPRYNRSLKKFDQAYGLYLFEDRRGYLRLALEKIKKNLKPIYTFNLIWEGQSMLRKLVTEYRLCQKLCFMQAQAQPCEGRNLGTCSGACEELESAADYNNRVLAAVEQLSGQLPSFAVIDHGKILEEKSCLLIEKGRFVGMGYLPQDARIDQIDELKSYLTLYPENDYVRGMIYQFVERYPSKKVDLRKLIS